MHSGRVLSTWQRPRAEPRPGPGGASPPAAAACSWCRTAVTGESFSGFLMTHGHVCVKANICAQMWTNLLRSSSHSLNWVTPLFLLDVFGPDVCWSAKSGHLTNQSHQFYADSLRFQRDQRCQEHWGVWRWGPLRIGRWTGLSRVGRKWPNLVMYLYVKVKGGIQHNTVPSCRIQMIWPRMSL